MGEKSGGTCKLLADFPIDFGCGESAGKVAKVTVAPYDIVIMSWASRSGSSICVGAATAGISHPVIHSYFQVCHG